jgi:hypothetical protein
VSGVGRDIGDPKIARRDLKELTSTTIAGVRAMVV